MPLSVSSNPSPGPVRKDLISVSDGSISGQVEEVIAGLHIQIAEMVRVYTDNQRANRDFKADLVKVVSDIDAMRVAVTDVNARQSRFVQDYDDARKLFAAFPSYSDRLSQLLQYVYKLSSSTAEFVNISDERLEALSASAIDSAQQFQNLTALVAALEIGLKAEMAAQSLRVAGAITEATAQSAAKFEARCDRMDASVQALAHMVATDMENRQKAVAALNAQFLELRDIADRDDWARLWITIKRAWARLRNLF